MKTKRCTKCGEIKSATAEYFHRDKYSKDSLGTQCKICRLKVSTIYAKTPAGIQARKRVEDKRKGSEKSKLGHHKQKLRHYGMTLEQYDRMFEDQDGVCAICGGINKSGRRLYVDHNHKTGKIRALLCCLCNNLIGNARENITILRSTINYLKEK